MNKARVIGVIGGIGCGKTTVCQFFSHAGFPVIDTDQVAKQLSAPGQKGLEAIITLMGREYLTTKGELDRKKMAETFFSQPKMKQQIEALLHPLIRQAARDQINQLKPNHSLIFVAIPVLQQLNQRDYQIDHVLLVECDQPQQIARVQNRDQRSLEQIQHIIQQQATAQQRLARADSVIYNNADLAGLKAQAQAWLLDMDKPPA